VVNLQATRAVVKANYRIVETRSGGFSGTRITAYIEDVDAGGGGRDIIAIDGTDRPRPGACQNAAGNVTTITVYWR